MSSLWPFAFHCCLDKDEWMHRVLARGWLIESIYSSWIGILGVRCDARELVTWADELRVVDQKRLLQSSMRSREGQKRGQHPVCMIALHTFSPLGFGKAFLSQEYYCETDVIVQWQVALSQLRTFNAFSSCLFFHLCDTIAHNNTGIEIHIHAFFLFGCM